MPGQPVILDQFGGIVAVTRPEDLPEGASPRNNDVDFIVGRFVQRPGVRNVYSYEGNTYGPHGGGVATDVDVAGNAWSNPGNTLLNTGVYATCTLGGSNTITSSTSTGTSIGGGVAWSNPGNIDSPSAFASVSLSVGGTDYSPSVSSGSVSNSAGPANNIPPTQSITLSGFASVAATSATIYIPMTVSIVASMGGGAITLNYSTDGGNHWTDAGSWNSSFSGTIPIAITGITNLNTIQIQMVAACSCSPTGYATVSGSVSGWYAVILSSAQLTAQTLSAAISGLTIPSAATVLGIGVSFNADYSGVAPNFNVALNVGNADAPFTLTTAPAVYSSGGNGYLWGYGNWTAATVQNLVVNLFASSTGTTTVNVNQLSVTVYYTILLSSDPINIEQFTFALPSSSSATGIVLDAVAFGAGATIYAQLIQNGVLVGNVKSAQLGSGVATIPLGGATDLWGTNWNYEQIDSPFFGVAVWANAPSPTNVSIGYCTLTIYGTAASVNFNGIVPVEINQTDQVTLALDANGATWIENASNAPGQLALASGIPTATAGAYLKGVDANGVAFMAYSDLTQGISQPMQYNGSWCDRITQVGPGQAPTFTPIQASGTTFAISSISQPAQMSDPGDPGYFQGLQQSEGPSSSAPGNVVTVFYARSDIYGQDTDLVNAFNSGQSTYVYIAGTLLPAANGTYLVTSVGNIVPPGGEYPRWYFTFQVGTSLWKNFPGGDVSPGTYNRTLATITMSVNVPGLTVGNQITVSGDSVSSYNTVWPISQSLNSGEMAITETEVSGGVITYHYAMQSGAAPAAGELVTITNTTNANGLLNLTGTIITASGGTTGTFTVATTISTNYAVTAESGTGVTAGTVFTFDPGVNTLDTLTNPIYGAGTGGTLTFANASSNVITPGVKQGSVFFITRNGAVTRPAPPATFTIPTNCGSITASGIPIGPPNVVARGITFTESGQNEVAGANFYYYDTATSYIVNGITLTSDALIVPDNTSTSATFSFSDAVLLASDEIDIPGNDYFNLIELGNLAWIFQYANRMLYGLCQTKIQNFLNMSFDGGYIPTKSQALSMPTGWNAPAANSSMGLVQSLDFGNAFRIMNPNISAWTDAQVLTQFAYQDYLNVNIIQPNTAYSVRVKARSIGADAQTVTIQLPTYSNGVFSSTLFGSASFTFNQGGYEIQSSPLIGGNGLSTVPSTLQLAIGVSTLAVGAGVEIDRIEIFPTNLPVDTTTVWTSYAGKFESVDINTGTLGVGADNLQPATGAFEVLEQLYIQKTKSLVVTQDSPNYEPNYWMTKQASDRAGSIGPNAFDEGEEFTISASRNGVYYFDGGKPQPILRELQSVANNLNLWETINWNAGKTLWIRNDLNNRRLLIGVPMNTPNAWLPLAPASTPTSPNVILMCNYTGCPTGADLAESGEVHVTMFGDLKSLDMRRKWSLWQIPCPVAEFVPRADGFTSPLFLCNGVNSSKIYQLVPGAPDGSGQNTDDGNAINWSYTTCAFVKGKAGQQVQGLGALRKIAYYLTATMEGLGQVAAKLYANSLGALGRNTFTIPLPFTLSSPQQNDQERTLEFGAQRIFVEFTSIGSGGYAEIGPVTLDMEADKNSSHRGVSS